MADRHFIRGIRDLSGERRTFNQGRAETTEQDIVQLEGEIASLENVIAHIEKQSDQV